MGLYNSFAAGRHFEGEGRVEAIRWCMWPVNSDFRGGYCDCNSQTHSDVPYEIVDLGPQGRSSAVQCGSARAQGVKSRNLNFEAVYWGVGLVEEEYWFVVVQREVFSSLSGGPWL